MTKNLGQVPRSTFSTHHQQRRTLTPIIIYKYFWSILLGKSSKSIKMNYAITFALLLYINVFYFGLFACVEFALLVFKCYQATGPKYPLGTMINEMFILAFLVVVESIRLLLGQKHEPMDFDGNLSAVFRILVLTVPSMYAVAYMTFWQSFVTRLDAALGMIMLLIQTMQFFSAMFCWWPNANIKNPFKRATSPNAYSRL